MISEAILIPKIYARLQNIASNFSKFYGGGPQTPAGARAFGARFEASPLTGPPFPKFLDPPLVLVAQCGVTVVVPRPTQPFIPPGSVNDQLRLRRQMHRAGMVSAFVDKRAGVQVKLRNPSTTRAIPER